MATHDYVLANASGAAFRTDLNNALAAIVSNNSNSSAPATTYAYQIWVDTSANIIKIRNSANNAWINLFTTAGGVDVDAASNFNEDVTFTGASANIIFDKSADDLIFNDNAKAAFGTSSDLQIFHDSSFSRIKDTGANALIFQSGEHRIQNEAADESMAIFKGNGAVELYYDNTKRLETTNSGASITGNAVINLTSGVAGQGEIAFGASGRPFIEAFDSGNHGSGAGINFRTGAGDYMAKMKFDNAVELYYDNAKKLETVGSGVAVTGYLSASTNIFTNEILSITGTNDNSTSHVSIAARNAAGGNGEYLIVGVSGDNFFGAGANNYNVNPAGNNTDAATTIRVHSGISANAFNDAHRFGRNGDGSIMLFMSAGGTEGSISISGSTTSFNTSSDYRLKENIIDLTDGITRIKQLIPRRFNFIKDATTTKDGFLAHEVSSIVPEAVEGTKDETYTKDEDDNNIKAGDPKYQVMDAGKLIPLLTAAVKEAIVKIETLETKVAQLEAS